VNYFDKLFDYTVAALNLDPLIEILFVTGGTMLKILVSNINYQEDAFRILSQFLEFRFYDYNK